MPANWYTFQLLSWYIIQLLHTEYTSGSNGDNKKVLDQLINAGLLVVMGDRFALTSLGKTLNTKSHWMTLWLTQLLVELGFSVDSIIWNAHNGGDEVDLVAQYKSKAWIFELKDKDFDLDKAHSLPFRMRKFKADKLFVVTTGKVSKDARHAFGEIASTTIAIEGIDKTRTVLEQVMLDTQLDYINEVQKELSRRMDIALFQIFERKYGKLTPVRFQSKLLKDFKATL